MDTKISVVAFGKVRYLTSNYQILNVLKRIHLLARSDRQAVNQTD